MSRQHLKVAMGLPTGHTTLTAHLFKFRLTGLPTCVGTENKIVYIFHIIVRHWHAKDTEPWVMFFMPKDLRNISVNDLTSLVVNTRLAIMP